MSNRIQTEMFGNEEDMVAFAMSQPLDVKERKAVEMLRMYCKNKSGVIVCNSGGKDSGVIMQLAKLAGIDFRAVYSNTTIDPPELVKYLRTHSKSTVWINQPVGLLIKMQGKSFGPPTRKSRWCCEEYKESSVPCSVKIIGVRAKESQRRVKLWREFVVDKKDKTAVILCPILYWTEKDVWQFHENYKLPYCELYDDPHFTRLGCVMCPLVSCKHKKYEAKKWPRFAQAWETAVKKNWNLWRNVKRESPRWIKPYNGESHLITMESSDIQETRIIDGVEYKGFWTWKRYQAGYRTAEDFWQWWLNDDTPISDECQYSRLLI